ncbi:SDR family oxidoreductase [Polynucleobacter paneuropaeus]|nr:SDR family oxidoreductase [Polynucleobacter paneuropaeus]
MSNKILILGASGMLGSTLLKYFFRENYDVYGTVRNIKFSAFFDDSMRDKIRVYNYPGPIEEIIYEIKPDYVINCIGIIKQHSKKVLVSDQITINSLLPHYLDEIINKSHSRLIQISTDCVFSGAKGMYSEIDIPDATDVYGRTKCLGEVLSSNSITLRTSIIGHELSGCHSLIDWFLSQEASIKGYTNAIFSGMPTVELARIIGDFVIPNPHLHGIYHVSSNPISKFDLLQLVASEYDKKIEIIEDSFLKIDRSLDSSKFQELTGFRSKSWPELLHLMHQFG